MILRPAVQWRCRSVVAAVLSTRRPASRVARAAADSASSLQSSQADRGLLDAWVPQAVWGSRLDVWISEQIPEASRTRVQDSIRKGFATVNGRTITKPSYVVEGGDHVMCSFAGATPSEALPENIKLDIVFEDEHLIVVNKSADMVVHPAPGHSSGTLVNAILYHCGLPAVKFSRPKRHTAKRDATEGAEDAAEEEDEDDVEEEDEEAAPGVTLLYGPDPVIRPGIVHRLDKGTSGLIVVAKDEHAHAHLAEQFKSRTARRTYLSLMCGTPSIRNGRIEAPIIRDPRDRKRMSVAESESQLARARFAASRYKVLEVLAEGGATLTEWKLETGRTHQIRVHAQCLGFPILGDDVYGGTEGYAASILLGKLTSSSRNAVQKLLSEIHRPCLHAYSLGFQHPWTKKEHDFKAVPPADFEKAWKQLREIKAEKN